MSQRLRASGGKSELKKSLGGDFAEAKRKYCDVVVDLRKNIEIANSAKAYKPGLDDIEVASHRYFTRMTELQRGKIISVGGEQPTTTQERIASLEKALGLATVLRRSPISRCRLGLECERADAAKI